MDADSYSGADKTVLCNNHHMLKLEQALNFEASGLVLAIFYCLPK